MPVFDFSTKLRAMRSPLLFIALSCLLPALHTLEAQEDNPLTIEQEKSAYKAADIALNNSYKKANKTLSDWDFNELKEDQREWIEFRDERSRAAAILENGSEFEELKEASVAYWHTMNYVTQTRTRIIDGWINESGRELVWEGEWTDGYGGWLRIAQGSTKVFRFDIEVARGSSYHLGTLKGKAKTNDSMAFFSDAGTDEKTEEDPETWLIFEKGFSGPRLRIQGINTEYYQGGRAYFGGTYTRVGDLDKTARKEVQSWARAEAE